MWMSELDSTKNLITGDLSSNGFRYGPIGNIEGLAQMIKIGSGQSNDIKSIPTVFERARLCEMGLFYNGGKTGFFFDYAQRIKEEWRALLAVCVTGNLLLRSKGFMLALKKIEYPAKLNYTRIALQQRTDKTIWKPSDDIFNPTTGHDRSGWTWDGMQEIVLLKDDEYMGTIAFTSPTTAVFPAADWVQVLIRFCPNTFAWIKEDRYFDPLNTKELSLSEQITGYLLDWLYDYRQFLKGTNASLITQNQHPITTVNEKWRGLLCDSINNGEDISLLGEFHSKLKSLYSNLGDSNNQPKLKTWRFDSYANGANTPSVISVVPKPLEIVDINESDVLIVSDALNRSTLLLVPELNDKIAVFPYTVAEVLANVKLKEEISKLVDILEETDIFLDDIFYAQLGCSEQDKEKLLSCLDDCCCSFSRSQMFVYFMPLKLKGLGLVTNGGSFKASQINVSDEDTNIEVSVDIELSSGKHCLLSHSYVNMDPETGHIKSLMSADMPMPLAAVWPSFDLKTSWKKYWLFCYDTPDSTDDFSYTNAEDINLPRAFRLRPLDNELESIAPENFLRNNGNHKYFCLSNFPKYLVLEGAKNKADDTYKRIGYLKVKSSINCTIPTNAPSYRFSMDFGTTSTVVRSETNGQFHELSEATVNLGAGNIIQLPILGSSGEQRIMYISKYFLQSLEMPFATLLYDYEPSNTAVTRGLYETSRIYHKEIRVPNQYLLPENKVESNLKWSADSNTELAKVFFMNVFSFVLLDAVVNGVVDFDKITMFASYPTSMRTELKNAFKDSTLEQLKNAAAQFTVLLDGDNSSKMPTRKYVTESEAAAWFFISQHNVGATCERLCVIDIGGGTSDIFYTEIYPAKLGDKKRAFDSSLKIGARDILVKALFKSRGNRDINAEKPEDKPYLYRLLYNANLLAAARSDAPMGDIDIDKLLHAGDGENGTTNTFASIWEGYLNRKIRENGVDILLGDKLINEYFRDATKTKTDSDKWLLSIIAINVACIVYYAGMLIRAGESKHDIIELAFAGNGSKMMDWFGNARVFETFLALIMKSAILNEKKVTSAADTINVHVLSREKDNNKRKLEAVIGMLPQSAHNRELSAPALIEHESEMQATSIILAGESYNGIKAMEIFECEALLSDAVAEAKQSGLSDGIKDNYDAKIVEENKKRKQEYLLNRRRDVNSPVSDLTKENFIAMADVIGDRMTKEVEFDSYVNNMDIGIVEFESFIAAYNAAMRGATSSITNYIFPINPVAASTKAEIVGDSLILPIDKWRKNRNNKIIDYIKAIQNNATPERKSFFLIGLEELNRLLMEEL